MIEKILFYLFAFGVIGAALGVVLVKNPVKAVLCLILTFFSSAGLWLLLEAEFLAITLVLVYVGAVMVLFLFVVMMLDIDDNLLSKKISHYLPAGGIVGVLLVWGLSKSFYQDKFLAPFLAHSDGSDVKTIGLMLYSKYLYAFELAGLILLVAIVAAISLTFRGRRRRQMISADQQVLVKKEHRIRLIHDNTL